VLFPRIPIRYRTDIRGGSDNGTRISAPALIYGYPYSRISMCPHPKWKSAPMCELVLTKLPLIPKRKYGMNTKNFSTYLFPIIIGIKCNSANLIFSMSLHFHTQRRYTRTTIFCNNDHPLEMVAVYRCLIIVVFKRAVARQVRMQGVSLYCVLCGCQGKASKIKVLFFRTSFY